ncbi:Holliday junction branch migration protein RuvA [Thauera linaloolentis]|uniref:Holliday junction branch migration complex subunit RuvA n=1 Tax=Thauera linaloolentis (strain DSM 12138 / JCM 21573 / CCUG 41526 / CIP 105981 / IAM 15112 / NBRC 102519 / 47Lol) TaxID=1123367 RepID=N6Y6P4_THAL4|nr:Holliday junction branch migration protein RuvA [Thauera linaloolentis]ENO89866.1 Holliday junction DNA helicase RuvA [Thauera linaloolentis 47Lol = DSM 12138]MCM8564587.1 Holliday junction branch migration protein RuvA [Thauera linaloolentis]
MIGRLTGTLLEKNPPQILVDVHGVGYEVDVPMSTFYGLPATGAQLSLYTHHVVREDGHFLFGFATDEERAAFRQLLKVSGVGARMALAVLSGLSVNDLAQAVALQEAGRLVKIPGIGKKTAERLLLELRDKLGKALPSMAGTRLAAAPGAVPDTRSDILNALLALGYNEREALGAMKGLDEGASVSEGIRQALKLLSRG